jgi:YD repeat-containing protein
MRSYQYGGVSYANPDAVTQIGNGLSTTTYAYDNNGNLVQKTTDGTTTTYVYDYANRLIALGSGGATTTYGYDAFGSRVLQTGTSTTYFILSSGTVSHRQQAQARNIQPRPTTFSMATHCSPRSISRRQAVWRQEQREHFTFIQIISEART